jgi:6-pyruvoyltetrahydropterin/6-carboxytetrahydropterin synthase
MFTVIVETGFSAIHSVVLPDGTLEPPHGHDWRVRAHFAAEALNEFGMVVDFEEAKKALSQVAAQLEQTNLNENPEIPGPCPTAEVVARHIFEQIRRQGLPSLKKVEVTEAPGCVAAYEP